MASGKQLQFLFYISVILKCNREMENVKSLLPKTQKGLESREAIRSLGLESRLLELQESWFQKI